MNRVGVLQGCQALFCQGHVEAAAVCGVALLGHQPVGDELVDQQLQGAASEPATGSSTRTAIAAFGRPFQSGTYHAQNQPNGELLTFTFSDG